MTIRRPDDERDVQTSADTALADIKRGFAHRDESYPAHLDDDIHGAALVGAMEGLATFDPALGNKRTHLIKRAKYAALQYLRDEAKHIGIESISDDETREAAYEVRDPAPSALDMLIDQEQTERLDSAMSTLPNRIREIVERHAQGDTSEQIASDMNVSAGHVRRLRQLGLRELRQALSD